MAKKPESVSQCPFCGSSKPIAVWKNQLELFYVQCMICNGSGPHAGTPEEAIVKWNVRVIGLEEPEKIHRFKGKSDEFPDFDP